jgi:hypothetical protein
MTSALAIEGVERRDEILEGSAADPGLVVTAGEVGTLHGDARADVAGILVPRGAPFPDRDLERLRARAYYNGHECDVES